MTEEFLLEKNLERIVSTKNRLDALMISLVLATVFAFFYRDCTFEHAQIFGLDITHHDPYYHYSVAILLTTIFGLVGSHFIEYAVKRSTYDELVKTKSASFDDVIKSTVPGSFYEFTYQLTKFKKNDKLRELAVGVLIIAFFASHYIAFLHIIERFDEQSVKSILILSVSVIVLISLYIGFIKSMGKAKKKLEKQVTKRIIAWFMIVLVLGLIFNFI